MISSWFHKVGRNGVVSPGPQMMVINSSPKFLEYLGVSIFKYFQWSFVAGLGPPQIIVRLVVWNMNFIFLYILGMSSSPLTFIFFRGVGILPTN